MSVAAVILAAGSGSRFGAPGEKLLTPTHGRPLLAHAVAPAVDARLDEVIVVSGSIDVSDAVPTDVTLLQNDEWRLGQSTSLRVALDWCHRQGHRSAVVGLGDLPGLTAEAWRAVADAPGGPIIVAMYGKRRGHPVRLDDEIWPSLPIDGDEGARTLMARRPELVTEVACNGRPADIDTREDLRKWS